MLYTESDLEKSMDKIETIHFHQVLQVYSKWNIYFYACKYMIVYSTYRELVCTESY